MPANYGGAIWLRFGRILVVVTILYCATVTLALISPCATRASKWTLLRQPLGAYRLSLPFIAPQVMKLGSFQLMMSSDERSGDDGSEGSLEEEEDYESIEDSILRIIKTYLDADSSEGGISSVNPKLLVENAHVLAKGRYYEEIISSLIKDSESHEETTALERVDAFLNGFIQAERRSRARLKVNYIIAGATTNRLDESINLLSESDEIDEDLLTFLDMLIKKEIMMSKGPASTDEDENDLEGTEKVTVDVLRMIKRRLMVQIQTGENLVNVKLLAALIAENDHETREKMLRSSLLTVESIESFSECVRSGIQYITEGANIVDVDISDSKTGGRILLRKKSSRKLLCSRGLWRK